MRSLYARHFKIFLRSKHYQKVTQVIGDLDKPILRIVLISYSLVYLTLYYRHYITTVHYSVVACSVISSVGLRSERLGFETYHRRVVSLGKTFYSPKVLVIPRKRWLRPDMTEKWLTWTLKLKLQPKQTKQTYTIV